MRWTRRTMAPLATTGLLAAGAVSSAEPATASGAVVHCPSDDLATAILAAPTGSTVTVDGTCTGTFVVTKDLTIVGPATLDGNGAGSVVTVAAGTVELDRLTIQHGTGTFCGALCGGDVFVSGGNVTINASTISANTALGDGPGTGGGSSTWRRSP